MQEEAPAVPAAAADTQPAADAPAVTAVARGDSSPQRPAANGDDGDAAAAAVVPPPPPAAAVAEEARLQQQQREQDGGATGGWTEAAPAGEAQHIAGPTGPLGNIKFKLKL